MATRKRQLSKRVRDPAIELERVLAGLEDARLRRDRAESAIDRGVLEARKLGASWDEIGRAVLMTGSGAMRRWK